MGVSVSVSIVIGVKSGELVKEEITNDTFEIHDERGRPTGKFKTESIKTIYLVNEPMKKVKDEGYIENITDILNINDYPMLGEFGFHNSNYESRDYLETGIIGVSIERNADLLYTGDKTKEISLEEIVDISKRVEQEILNRYGVKVEPKVYQISSVG